MARLDNGFIVTPEDVFLASARLLDFLMSKADVNQHQVDSMWDLLYIDIMKWGTNVTARNKKLIADTVFQVVRATLTQYFDTFYCETVSDLLNDTIERNVNDCDKKEQAEFHKRLMKQTPELCEWINSYDEAGEWLSDQILDIISLHNQQGQDEFKPSGNTFTKTALLTDTLLDIVGQRLSKANKLKASPDDWRKLFSGINQQFDMIWLGTEGELRDLFKMFTDEPIYATPKRNYQNILKSHFLDEHGNRFNNLHGAKSVEKFQPILDDCVFLLQHLTDSVTKIMKQLISDNEDALREAGYFDNVKTVKQSGLRIRNKRR